MRILEGIIIGICITAIAASGKAIVDVHVLKESKENIKEDIKEIKDNIKYIRDKVDKLGN